MSTSLFVVRDACTLLCVLGLYRRCMLCKENATTVLLALAHLLDRISVTSANRPGHPTLHFGPEATCMWPSVPQSSVPMVIADPAGGAGQAASSALTCFYTTNAGAEQVATSRTLRCHVSVPPREAESVPASGADLTESRSMSASHITKIGSPLHICRNGFYFPPLCDFSLSPKARKK